jgi:hypothetical protein
MKLCALVFNPLFMCNIITLIYSYNKKYKLLFYCSFILFLALLYCENNKPNQKISTIIMTNEEVLQTDIPINENMINIVITDPLWTTINNGLSDSTKTIQTILSKGGDIFIPNGTYFFDYAGDDIGGVNVYIKKTTRITCDTDVYFIARQLDNDMIRFIISNNGISPGLIDFEWHGGIFNQTLQKNSSVLPFGTNFPVKLAGKSQTCDGLSIRGSYFINNNSNYGINNCIIDGVQFIAGDHWLNGGGDSALFVEGCKNVNIQNCKMNGNRDCGIYTSTLPDGKNIKLDGTLIENKTVITNNIITNCFHAVACKRSSRHVFISNNNVTNCVRSFALQWLMGDGSLDINIQNNTATKCNVFIQMQKVNGFVVSNNTFTNLGTLLPNNTIPNAPTSACGIEIDNSTNGIINNNTLTNLTPTVKTVFPKSCKFINFINNSLNCKFNNNIISGLITNILFTGINNSNSFINNIII